MRIAGLSSISLELVSEHAVCRTIALNLLSCRISIQAVKALSFKPQLVYRDPGSTRARLRWI